MEISVNGVIQSVENIYDLRKAMSVIDREGKVILGRSEGEPILAIEFMPLGAKLQYFGVEAGDEYVSGEDKSGKYTLNAGGAKYCQPEPVSPVLARKCAEEFFQKKKRPKNIIKWRKTAS